VARALGIDVGIQKGLDLVLLEENAFDPIWTRRGVRVEELTELLAEWKPDVVAIDSPPSFATRGGMRETEAALRRLGIQSYATPWDPERAKIAFYDWMRMGFAVFEAAAAAGYPRYRAGNVSGTALEVFPHASAVVLAGTLGPARRARHDWRRSVLLERGVNPRALTTNDEVDAALAALTGLFALRGEFAAPGDPEEGIIVVPTGRLPEVPYGMWIEPAVATLPS
jgi:predicted nuclease with RNAse H fold